MIRWSRTLLPSTTHKVRFTGGGGRGGGYGVVEGEVKEGVETVGLVFTCVTCVSVKDFADGITVGDVIHHLSVEIGD